MYFLGPPTQEGSICNFKFGKSKKFRFSLLMFKLSMAEEFTTNESAKNEFDPFKTVLFKVTFAPFSLDNWTKVIFNSRFKSNGLIFSTTIGMFTLSPMTL